MGKYFGTDGIRGRVNEFLTVDLALSVGKALSLLPSKKVVIGYDTRLSNHMLCDAISAGALSKGLNVIDAGVITTPGLAFYSYNHKITGVMITASHNPYHDNGIKIFVNGQKLSDEQEANIEEFISNPRFDYTSYDAKLEYSSDPITEYCEYLVSLSKPTTKSIALDTANGATYAISQDVYSCITNKLYVIANEPDGKNINQMVGATHMENISQFVVQKGLDLGFSFDGDGDRLLVVDDTGKIYTGDEIIYIIASYYKQLGKLNNSYVVLTKMSNLGIINSLMEKGISTLLTDVGDRNVLEAMLANNYVIGGENSGHIIMTDLLKTGDGIISSIILLNILEETGLSLSELTSSLTIYPDKLVNLKVKDKKIAKTDVVINRVNQVNTILGSTGKIIVRASGTENLLRINVCAKSQDIVDKYINEFVELINTLDK